MITDRGEPIAELRPLQRTNDAVEAALARLEAQGTITRAHVELSASFRPVKLRGPAASKAIDEDREDRF